AQLAVGGRVAPADDGDVVVGVVLDRGAEVQVGLPAADTSFRTDEQATPGKPGWRKATGLQRRLHRRGRHGSRATESGTGQLVPRRTRSPPCARSCASWLRPARCSWPSDWPPPRPPTPP